MDLKIEVVPIPVSDVDAAKAFYTEKVGFNLDHDMRPNDSMRVVQMTPPGSHCSVVIGEGLPLGDPGSVKGVPRLTLLLLRGSGRQRVGRAGAEALVARALHAQIPE
jgi:catechol 2,3-dioxygenase-like lactoylglutathione lyase family enzyme